MPYLLDTSILSPLSRTLDPMPLEPAKVGQLPRRFQFTLLQAFLVVTVLAILLSLPFGDLLLILLWRLSLEALCPAVVILGLLMLLQWPLLWVVNRCARHGDSQLLD